MRNTVKTIAALLIVLSAVKVEAKADPKKEVAYCKVVAQENVEAYKVIYKGAEKSDVTVTWKDEDGEVVFTESLDDTEGFIKQYNLSALPDGSYTVTVEAINYTHTASVLLGDMSAFVYHLKQKENNVILTGTQPSNTSVTVVILDEDKDVIFKETVENTDKVQKKYNFEKIDTDEVTFVMYNKDKIFKEETIKF